MTIAMTPFSRRGFLAHGLSGCALCAVASPLLARVSPRDMKALVSTNYQPKDVDERGLWHACERLERDIAASNLLVRDPELNTFVRKVTERLLGEMAADVRIYIVRDPDFNASMAPNGMMIVHTGLLARMRNEAQLAAVLGHEAGHYLRRHSLERWRDLKSTTAIMSVVALGAGAATGPTGTNWYGLANAINVGLLLAFLSYGREAESEADAYGVQLMDDGRYPASAASEIWAQFAEERKASAAARKKRYRDRSNSAVSTHPPNDLRMRDLAVSAAEIQPPSNDGGRFDDGRDAWRAAIAPIRTTLIDEQVKLNDPGASLYLVSALAQDGWDATLRYFEGEVYRLRDETGDSDRAAQAFAAAVEFPDALPEAHRAHGYAQIKAGNTEAGRRALARYLELNPNAADAAMVKFSMGER